MVGPRWRPQSIPVGGDSGYPFPTSSCFGPETGVPSFLFYLPTVVYDRRYLLVGLERFDEHNRRFYFNTILRKIYSGFVTDNRTLHRQEYKEWVLIMYSSRKVRNL